MTKRELIERRAVLQAEADTLLVAIENNTISEEQQARANGVGPELHQVNREIDRLEAMESQIRSVVSRRHAVSVVDNAAEKPWANPGEFLYAVARYGVTIGREVDPRLQKLAPLGANEGVASEGGFAVIPTFATELYDLAHAESQIASRCREVPISGNAIKIPAIDETSRANGSRYGGIQAYWAAEAATVTATKPALRQISLELKKLFALCYSTDELIADAVALNAWIRTTFPKELGFKLDDSIFRGSGAGQPLGIMNSGALVSVAKESGQTASTVVAANVAKMYSRMHASSRKNAVWLVNQDVEPQLPLMTIGQMPVYLPSGSLQNPQSYGLLFGRPVLSVEQCETIGTQGDIMFADLGQYLLATKAGGMQAEVSMHVRFIYDEMTFRFIVRVDGAPLWASSLTPFKGTNTQSPFVVLDTRS